MWVRCSFCNAEYDAPVTARALDLVDRCERCGRAQLRPVDPREDMPDPAAADPARVPPPDGSA